MEASPVSGPGSCTVRALHLSKTLPKSSSPVVNDITFGCSDGDCFGLIGTPFGKGPRVQCLSPRRPRIPLSCSPLQWVSTTTSLRTLCRVCVAGANGAGKSTTLSMLMGLLAPSTGRADLCGHDVSRFPWRALPNLGVCFQETVLGTCPFLTGAGQPVFFKTWNQLLALRLSFRCLPGVCVGVRRHHTPPPS